MANDLELLIRLLPWLVANNGAALSEVSEHFAISEKHALELISQLVVTGPSQAGGGLVDIDFEDADSIFVTDAKALDRETLGFISMTMIRPFSGFTAN